MTHAQTPQSDADVSNDEPAIEEENRDSDLMKPWDPRQIRVTTKNFTIREIYNQIEEKELALARDFKEVLSGVSASRSV